MSADRFVLVILDGLGDRPHPETGGISPVESARTPHLDRLASEGQLGRVTVVGPGIAPESDSGVFALLGYDPVRDSPGRGILEAIGVGIPLAPGDVALRLNFATTDGSDLVTDARVGRSLTTLEAEALAGELTRADLLADEGISAEVRASVGHRGILWLHPLWGILSPEVTNADPFYEKVGGMGRAIRPREPRTPRVTPTGPAPEAARTADAIERFLKRASELLSKSGVNARRAIAGQKVANGLLLRNAGALSLPPPQPFAERHGHAGAAITEMPVERGIARVLGLADQHVGPMGPDRVGGYGERARATLSALEEFPFVYVHLKGPDEPGHDGDAPGKRAVVETIDSSFFGPFLAGLDRSRSRLIVTADHATPAILKGHSDDPVPLVLAGAGVAAPVPTVPLTFGERAAAQGILGELRGADVLPLLFGPAIPRRP